MLTTPGNAPMIRAESSSPQKRSGGLGRVVNTSRTVVGGRSSVDRGRRKRLGVLIGSMKPEAHLILRHGFTPNAQNQVSFSTTFAFVKPATISASVNPLFGCPE